MVKNPPCNAGDLGAIPGGGTKILYATDLLSPRAATRESTCRNERPCMMKRRPNAANILKNKTSQILEGYSQCFSKFQKVIGLLFGGGGKGLSKGINIYMEMQRTKTTSDGNLLCSFPTTMT